MEVDRATVQGQDAVGMLHMIHWLEDIGLVEQVKEVAENDSHKGLSERIGRSGMEMWSRIVLVEVLGTLDAHKKGWSAEEERSSTGRDTPNKRRSSLLDHMRDTTVASASKAEEVTQSRFVSMTAVAEIGKPPEEQVTSLQRVAEVEVVEMKWKKTHQRRLEDEKSRRNRKVMPFSVLAWVEADKAKAIEPGELEGTEMVPTHQPLYD